MEFRITDPMTYQTNMQIIESNLMECVLSAVRDYEYEQYTTSDVQRALQKDHLNTEDFAALLSPAAQESLETMAAKAKKETASHFGNSVSLFTPLYIANFCENYCVYCGFNCTNKINRGKLKPIEIERELKAIAQTGLKEILILTGESRSLSGVEYIGDAIRQAKQCFSTIGIEIYPLNIDEYAYLHQCGADYVSVYQETYDPIIYESAHVHGPKRVFPYRFNAQERALLGGMRGVGIGALLGLGNFRKDAFAAGVHAMLLQQKYPHADISFSVPRLRPFINNVDKRTNDVHEKQLLQVILAFRLFMPFSGITISTRERAGFRDHVVGLAATKISAGVSVGVGGHADSTKGDGQFEISDIRSVQEIRRMLFEQGLQPVYSDYMRM